MRLSHEKGFSLIETTVGLALLGLVISSVILLENHNQRMLVQQKRSRSALELHKELISLVQFLPVCSQSFNGLDLNLGPQSPIGNQIVGLNGGTLFAVGSEYNGTRITGILMDNFSRSSVTPLKGRAEIHIGYEWDGVSNLISKTYTLPISVEVTNTTDAVIKECAIGLGRARLWAVDSTGDATTAPANVGIGTMFPQTHLDVARDAIWHRGYGSTWGPYNAWNEAFISMPGRTMIGGYNNGSHLFLTTSFTGSYSWRRHLSFQRGSIRLGFSHGWWEDSHRFSIMNTKGQGFRLISDEGRDWDFDYTFNWGNSFRRGLRVRNTTGQQVILPSIVEVGSGSGRTTEKFYVNGSAGGVNSWDPPSDRRLKKDITPLTDSLKTLTQLNGYTFDWECSPLLKDCPLPESKVGQQDVGFIAQEVKAIFKEAHVPSPHLEKLQYADFIPLLVSAHQELKEKADEEARLYKEVIALTCQQHPEVQACK